MLRILIIEDDEAMLAALRLGFEHEGYSVLTSSDGSTGMHLASEKECDIIILDIMLPKISGLDVCQRLRRSGNKTPLIMLTARGQEIDKVVGLRSGADDYLTKPFSFLELLARVEAVLRRSSPPAKELGSYSFGDVELDFKSLGARKGGKALALSAREYRILSYLIQRRGEVVTRDQLLDAVWGYENFPMTRTVDTHLAKLRQKIEDDPGEPRYIVTVHRVGYKFTG